MQKVLLFLKSYLSKLQQRKKKHSSSLMVPNTLSDFELLLHTQSIRAGSTKSARVCKVMLSSNKVAANKIFEMVKQKPTINSVSIIDVGKQLQDLQGHVEFHNVEFS
jgi:hypothetical protein